MVQLQNSWLFHGLLQSINVFSKAAISIYKNYISKLTQKTKPAVKRNMIICLLNEKQLKNLLIFL